jgi:hypothetical protein
MIDPWKAMLPAMASPILSARVVLNARWVKWRLNATRGAQAGEEVEEHRQPDVGPAQPPAPGQRDSGQQGKQGKQGHYHEDLDQQLLTGRALSVEQRADTGPLNWPARPAWALLWSWTHRLLGRSPR